MTRKDIKRKAIGASLALAAIGLVGNIFLLNVGREKAMPVAYSMEVEEGTVGGDAVEERAAAASPGFWDGINAKYLLDKLFTLGWGLGQIVIGAWAGMRFRARKQEKMMTESQIDRRVDARMAEEYAKLHPDRRKK